MLLFGVRSFSLKNLSTLPKEFQDNSSHIDEDVVKLYRSKNKKQRSREDCLKTRLKLQGVVRI